MREIWMMQPRFERRTGSSPFGLAGQPRFRAAFDFLRLRADAGEVPEELATWWEDFSLESDAGREAMVQEQRDLQKHAQRDQQRKQQRLPVSPSHPGMELPPGATFEAPSQDAAADSPAKKRRRRRKPRPAEGGSLAPEA
jgi:poly(A) polymerase